MIVKMMSQENDTVAAMCMRFYGYTKGVVEAVMNANPHLHQYGAILPDGVIIVLPEPPAKTAQSTVTLW